MKFIRIEDGTYYFEEYFKYLETIKDKLPSNVFAFASNWKHYSMYDHESLHDAWLHSVNIEETLCSDETSQLRIFLHFLGAYHDMYIDITYYDVSSYCLQGIFRHPYSKTAETPHLKTVHGDLLTHEVSLTDKEKVCHEIQFDKGSSFVIVCTDIVCQLTQL